MLPNEIASFALNHYQKKIPAKGKPQPRREWTVFAAIVAEQKLAEQKHSTLRVLSCATGTKCTSQRVHGCVLHDCHAEVLARRGLQRILWKEISKEDSTLLEASSTGQNKFRLRSDIKLHLYISCSPCGDATIYPVSDDQVMLHTGAKVIVSEENKIDASACGGDGQLLEGTAVAREKVQILGKLRTKSGRSNLPAHLRSTSMSCSDKIVKWSVLGLQGGLLSGRIENIYLSSIILSKDPRVVNAETNPQKLALERAISDRIRLACAEIPSENRPPTPCVAIVDDNFPSDKAMMEVACISKDATTPKILQGNNSCSVNRKRKRDQGADPPISSCGVSLNWQCFDEEAEVIVGARGVRQGKKPKSQQDYHDLASRLCRNELAHLAMAAVGASSKTKTCKDEVRPRSYQELKQVLASEEWCGQKLQLLRDGALSGWLRNDKDADFNLDPLKHPFDQTGT